MRRSKFNNRKTIVDSITFDSSGEARRYCDLKLMQCVGEISDLSLQPEFVLQEPFTDSSGEKHRAIKYRADFKYLENDKWVIEDFKGHITAEFNLKKKLFLKRYPEYKFRVTG